MNGHLLSLTDIGPDGLKKIVDLSLKIKASPENYDDALKGKQIAVLFEKPSTRTRLSLEVGISQLGANAITLSPSEIQISRGESIADTARVFSRYLDALIVRTKSHARLQELAKYSDIPVINGLSDLYHPLQIIADIVTISENNLKIDETRLCFLGDTNNNVCRSVILGGALSGMEVVLSSPEAYFPDNDFLEQAKKLGVKLFLEKDPAKAVAESDVLYTDVWVSMGDEEEAEARKRDLTPYQLNGTLYSMAKKNPIILHCLPAMKGEEISEEVFESENSRIFDQAENRLHSSKAVLLHALNKS